MLIVDYLLKIGLQIIFLFLYFLIFLYGIVFTFKIKNILIMQVNIFLK